MPTIDSQPVTSLLQGLILRAELARQLCKTPRTLYRWQVLGIGPRPTKIGSTTYYSTTAVADWLREREQGKRRGK